MIADKKTFFIGFVLFCAFVIVLAAMFSPIFQGQNALKFLDALYNSISKGSAYYVPVVRKESNAFAGSLIDVTLKMEQDEQAEQTALLFRKGGAQTDVSGSSITIKGDLGNILANCLEDADMMYNNDGTGIRQKYDYDERQVLYNWWKSLSLMDKQLTKQEMFKQAKIVATVQKKTVETSYNYYGIEAEKITTKVGVVVFSLIFYVVYTIWYGYAIMFMFQGLGLRLSH